MCDCISLFVICFKDIYLINADVARRQKSHRFKWGSFWRTHTHEKKGERKGNTRGRKGVGCSPKKKRDCYRVTYQNATNGQQQQQPQNDMKWNHIRQKNIYIYRSRRGRRAGDGECQKKANMRRRPKDLPTQTNAAKTKYLWHTKKKSI